MDNHYFIQYCVTSFVDTLKSKVLPFAEQLEVTIPVAIRNSGDMNFNDMFYNYENSTNAISSVPNISIYPPVSFSLLTDTSLSTNAVGNFILKNINYGTQKEYRGNIRNVMLQFTVECNCEFSNLLQAYSFYEYILAAVFPTFTFSLDVYGKISSAIARIDTSANFEFNVTGEQTSQDRMTTRLPITFTVEAIMPILGIYKNESMENLEFMESSNVIRYVTHNVRKEDKQIID